MLLKSIIIVLFIFISTLSYCQITDSLLINAQQRTVENYPYIIWKRRHCPYIKGNMTVQELFNSYFDSFRLFVLDFKFHSGTNHSSQAQLFAFDNMTKQLICFEREQSFIYTINHAKRKITNLDKCYLYIYLYRLETSHYITSPKAFSHQLIASSEFIKHEASDLFDQGNMIWNFPLSKKNENDVDTSSKEKIIIYVNKVREFEQVPWRYIFHFDYSGNLLNVEITK